LRRANERSIKVLGHLAPDVDADPTALGGLESIGQMIEEHNIDLVIIAGTVAPGLLRHLIEECLLHGTEVSAVPMSLRHDPKQSTDTDVLGWPVMRLPVPRRQLAQLATRRAVELLGTTVALVALSPVYLLVALAVKLDSPGPIFFSQWRPGLAGRRFRIIKFRTMRVDAEAILSADPQLYERFVANGCKFANGDDPRVSRLGLLLRQTSLDELPQLLNVLRGDMALVGPRPVIGPELESYGPLTRVVLGVKPGITGWWQVNGRSDVQMDERARLDAEYVMNWSLAMDARILLRTIPAVVKKTGAC
jgi:exopolysaccharide biosynthesis polyprenyl glycosylphosphotransferase